MITYYRCCQRRSRYTSLYTSARYALLTGLVRLDKVSSNSQRTPCVTIAPVKVLRRRHSVAVALVLLCIASDVTLPYDVTCASRPETTRFFSSDAHFISFTTWRYVQVRDAYHRTIVTIVSYVNGVKFFKHSGDDNTASHTFVFHKQPPIDHDVWLSLAVAR